MDYRNTRGIDLVRQLGLMNITERRNYFLAKLTCESILGIAPDYLASRILMRVDVHGYNTRGAKNDDVYPPRVKNSIFKRSLQYSGAIIWNGLPDHIKKCTNIDDFKRIYKNFYKPPYDMNETV